MFWINEIFVKFELMGFDGFYELEMLGEEFEWLSYLEIFRYLWELLMVSYLGINLR